MSVKIFAIYNFLRQFERQRRNARKRDPRYDLYNKK